MTTVMSTFSSRPSTAPAATITSSIRSAGGVLRPAGGVCRRRAGRTANIDPDATTAANARARKRRCKSIGRIRSVARPVRRCGRWRSGSVGRRYRWSTSATAHFEPDGGHRPCRSRAPVHVLKRGDIRRPGRNWPSPCAVPRCPASRARLSLADHGAGRQPPGGAGPTGSTRSDNVLDLAIDRQPRLALSFRPRASSTRRTISATWAAAVASRVARLAGRRVPRRRRLAQGAAPADRHQRDLPPIVDGIRIRRIEANPLSWLRMNRTRARRRGGARRGAACSDRLDRTMGGPSDSSSSMKPGMHVTPDVDYSKFDWDRPQGHRRSVYRFVFRTLPDPFVWPASTAPMPPN